MTAGEMPWLAGQSVRVSVPASSANLGPGFDSVGIGLEIRDECRLTVLPEPGLVVEVSGEGAAAVPRDERHLVVRSLRRAWEVLGVDPPAGVHLVCHNRVPHGRGLGSSATAIVTGLSAAYGLLALARTGAADVDLNAVNDLAAALEGHPDNSSASVFGGITLSWPDDGVTGAAVPGTCTLRLVPHPAIRAYTLVPEQQLSTATARAVLPPTVHLADAAANSARVGLLVHAVTVAPELLLPATRDYLHQEPRRPAYAESMAILDRMRAAGHAATISGAGPSVLVLTATEFGATETAALPTGWRAREVAIAADGVRVSGHVVAGQLSS